MKPKILEEILRLKQLYKRIEAIEARVFKLYQKEKSLTPKGEKTKDSYSLNDKRLVVNIERKNAERDLEKVSKIAENIKKELKKQPKLMREYGLDFSKEIFDDYRRYKFAWIKFFNASNETKEALKIKELRQKKAHEREFFVLEVLEKSYQSLDKGFYLKEVADAYFKLNDKRNNSFQKLEEIDEKIDDILEDNELDLLADEYEERYIEYEETKSNFLVLTNKIFKNNDFQNLVTKDQKNTYKEEINKIDEQINLEKEALNKDENFQMAIKAKELLQRTIDEFLGKDLISKKQKIN